jgi:hypothetical protein
MPAEYEYEYISKGRSKALERACIEVGELRRQLESSGVNSLSIIERIELLSALLARAAGHSLGRDQIQMLEQIFGKDLGEGRNKPHRPI